jgi:hypothetical protein
LDYYSIRQLICVKVVVIIVGAFVYFNVVTDPNIIVFKVDVVNDLIYGMMSSFSLEPKLSFPLN